MNNLNIKKLRSIQLVYLNVTVIIIFLVSFLLLEILLNFSQLVIAGGLLSILSGLNKRYCLINLLPDTLKKIKKYEYNKLKDIPEYNSNKITFHYIAGILLIILGLYYPNMDIDKDLLLIVLPLALVIYNIMQITNNKLIDQGTKNNLKNFKSKMLLTETIVGLLVVFFVLFMILL